MKKLKKEIKKQIENITKHCIVIIRTTIELYIATIINIENNKEYKIRKNLLLKEVKKQIKQITNKKRYSTTCKNLYKFILENNENLYNKTIICKGINSFQIKKRKIYNEFIT